MTWTTLHATLFSKAFEKVLGDPAPGAVAYVRCLAPEVVDTIAADVQFDATGWRCHRVADEDMPTRRTITADQAVELREGKNDAILLIVDTARSGAGMDGIYSAAKEIDERSLFNEALRLAARELTSRLGSASRDYAEQAIKRARGFGRLYSLSLWTEFDFYVRVATEQRHPGELLWAIGLWPIATDGHPDAQRDLGISRMFIDRLLGSALGAQTPSQRIESLRLLDPTEEQQDGLERFLRSAATRPLLVSLADLAGKRELWINVLKLEGATRVIRAIEWLPWQTPNGKLAKWSGLQGGADGEPPAFILDPTADARGDYQHMEVRWKVRPDNIERDVVQYQVSIFTDMDEELASRSVPHRGKREEKCRFTYDDFSRLGEDATVPAYAVISVIGNESVEKAKTDEFIIRFGTPLEQETVGVGKKVRSFSEGLIELGERQIVTTLASGMEAPPQDSKGCVVLRTGQRGKTYRVFRPALIREVEEDWSARSGEIGRWRVKVRASGARAGQAEFVTMAPTDAPCEPLWRQMWERTVAASRRMADRFQTCGGGVGQIYDQSSKVFESVVKEYMLAWAALLDDAGEPSLALANTVEVQSLSGRTIGMIVLPAHPLRVAWHVAYDNLVLYTRFDLEASPKEIGRELKLLDGAMFPAFLPGLEGGTFVFADTLGFHAVGMVPVDDREPKAAIAILARALGESESADTAPTVARQSAKVLGNEILKYMDCHDTSRLLHIHALRPGDGLTVARSLGYVHKQAQWNVNEDDAEAPASPTSPSFVLELYPSEDQRGLAGRFIAEAREKRRTGAGVLSNEDQWMLESTSLANGMTLPRLRWARKGASPKTAAHLAVAFDTFESRVSPGNLNETGQSRPYFAFGLMSFFERRYTSIPSPIWDSFVVNSTLGEKHPAERAHTERLVRLQQSVWNCVSRALGADKTMPTLRTEISPEKAQSLRELHRLCDWVITLDRNAGIEYFDSPRDNREIYDAYVIDCVPEREDLGCLQLITSTSNLDEIRNLLDEALGMMGLSRSRRNAEFLQEHLKALSGRLAIRLTGQKAPTAELIALAMCHANCHKSADDDDCWMSLRGGFFIPVDDIRDLLPPAADDGADADGVAEGGDAARKAPRPDLIFVSLAPRKGLLFRFAEVKYRRHLRTARGADVVEGVRRQVESLRERWEEWYGAGEICASFRAVRRAKLARVLRFYADKARRHADDGESGGLSREAYDELIAEIDRFIEKGGDYSFAPAPGADRGWIFCPEYMGAKPLEITPAGWNTRVFLFGPEFNFRRYSTGETPRGNAPNQGLPSGSSGNDDGAPPPPIENSEAPAATPDGATPMDSRIQSVGQAVDDPVSSGFVRPPAICLGTNLLSGEEVRWPLTIKGNPHLLVAGLPGMGKTTCLLNLCRQMLAAEIRPIVFSYHQDIDEKLQQSVGSVRFIDFNGLGFNPLRVIDRNSRMAYLDVAGAVRDIFVAIYPELGDIQGERIRKALKDSFIDYDWDDPTSEPSQLQEPPFSRFVEILRSAPKPDRGLKTLLSRLEELEDYGFFQAAEAQASLWESERPIVLRIHSTQNDNLQKAFASLVFYGLYKDMFRRGTQERITHALIFDEAHRAARLQLIPTMAKECRKYGISLVLASQEARDFHVSLFSAIANYLVLRLTEADAKALARNIATSDQERMLIDRIKQMDRFRGFYCSEGLKKPLPVALQP